MFFSEIFKNANFRIKKVEIDRFRVHNFGQPALYFAVDKLDIVDSNNNHLQAAATRLLDKNAR